MKLFLIEIHFIFIQILYFDSLFYLIFILSFLDKDLFNKKIFEQNFRNKKTFY